MRWRGRSGMVARITNPSRVKLQQQQQQYDTTRLAKASSNRAPVPGIPY